MNDPGTTVADSEYHGLVALLPAAARPFILLARLDRPIGWWLLFWPGGWAVALTGGAVPDWPLMAWLLLGAVVMRGAGCVYNDIVDRRLDAQVARTRLRPLASGTVSLAAAIAWLGILCLAGLAVLIQLHVLAALTALSSLALVAAYPFMKRITWWPQAWLGMVFSWAALVGWVEETRGLSVAGGLLYLGSVAWVIGYDTIYSLQDRDDDAMIGIRSSARRMGRHVRAGVALFYTLAVALWAGALWHVRADVLALAALLPVALHLGWQVATLAPDDGEGALVRFRANRGAGALMFAACLVVGLTAA